MGSITSYDKLEDLGRVRLSPNFFMRDFLYSEIAAWHGLRNVPDHPEQAIAVGRHLCVQLLEPLQGKRPAAASVNCPGGAARSRRGGARQVPTKETWWTPNTSQ